MRNTKIFAIAFVAVAFFAFAAYAGNNKAKDAAKAKVASLAKSNTKINKERSADALKLNVKSETKSVDAKVKAATNATNAKTAGKSFKQRPNGKTITEQQFAKSTVKSGLKPAKANARTAQVDKIRTAVKKKPSFDKSKLDQVRSKIEKLNNK